MKYQTYTKYKPSGIEWIGEIPVEWDALPVRGVAHIGRGRVISNEEIGENQGDYPVYSSQTSNGGEMGKINTYDFNGEYVTWTTDGANAGTAFYRNGKFNCTNVCGTLKKRSNNFNMLLLPYILNQGTKYYVRYDINPKLMNDMMARIRIPIASIDEQDKIADFLDRKTSQIDGLIKKDKRLIELLQERRIALINQAVTKGLDPKAKLVDSGVDWIGEIPEGWEVRKLKFVAQICNGQDQKDVLIDEGGYPIYGTGGEFGRASKYLYNKKSVLLGRKGTIDKPQFAEEPFWTVDTLFYTRIFEETFPKYFYYTTRCIDFYKYSETTTVPSMTQEKLNEILLPYPKYSEQKKIAEYIDNKTKKIDNHISGVVRRIGLLGEYKKSLIYNAVTGKIKV